MKLKWYQRLERKYRKYAIPDLMKYIVIINAVVFVLEMLVPNSYLTAKFTLNPALILRGEVWRLVTFLFIPPSSSPLWIVFTLYFYYMVGSNLEHQWGSFQFNLYYLIGVLSTIAAAFIGFAFTGYGTVTTEHLNLSLFLAFAYLFPNFEILIFFILPLKVKYLAWLNWGFIALSLLFNPLPMKLAALASVVNYFIFFGSDLIVNLKRRRLTYKNRKRFRDAFKDNRR
ncbi:MAG: rhomboid family intramembrane serine protease [Clostridiales bacterium]|nr:rhomboid family intramembrane serine protease [Clostridiales bacterium]